MMTRPRLQLVELAPETVHPDRAILDRISDPVAREVYRIRIEAEERRWSELDGPELVIDFDDFDGWEEDDG